jgi:hypothetical protein
MLDEHEKNIKCPPTQMDRNAGFFDQPLRWKKAEWTE